MKPADQWKLIPIPFNTQYEMSERGKVRKVKNHRPIKAQRRKNGDLYFVAHRQGYIKNINVRATYKELFGKEYPYV